MRNLGYNKIKKQKNKGAATAIRLELNELPRRKRSGYLIGTYFLFATSGGELTQSD